MKKNDMWKRARRIPVMLITEGLCVGLIGGFIVLLYRVALTFAGNWLIKILSYIKGNPFRCAMWFLILMALAWIVGRLVKWEPMISGSGIPQVEGEVSGRLSQNWKRVLPANLQVDFCVCWEGFRLEEKARRFSLERWPDREYPELWGGGKEKRSF